MKSPWLTHALWLALAAGAFAAGRLTTARHSHVTSSARASGSAPPPPPLLGTAASSSRAAASDDPTENPSAWIRQFHDASGVISAEKMADAMREALRASDPVKSAMYFAQLVKEMTPANAAAAFNTVRETVAGFESMLYLPMLTYQWGAIDGEKALASIKEIGGRDSLFNSPATLAGFASANPEAAKKWLAENRSAENRALLERSLVSGLARSDFAAATDYVMSLDEKERGQYVDVLVEQKIKNGLLSAADWALALGNTEMKTSALSRVADQYARQDPAKAADWVKQHASADFAQDAVGSVARQYAEKNPTAALTWAGTLPESAARTDAYGRIFREWGRSDPTAASETLNSMPAGDSKDEAITSFTRSIARENPEDAVTWAATISNPQEREAAQIEIVQRWRAADAAAASAWAASNLSPQAQQQASQPPRWEGRGGPRLFFPNR